MSLFRVASLVIVPPVVFGPTGYPPRPFRRFLGPVAVCRKQVLDALESRGNPERNHPFAGGFQRDIGVVLRQRQDRHAGLVRLLFNGFAGQHAFDYRQRAVADFARPVAETVAIPFKELLVLFRHVDGQCAIFPLAAEHFCVRRYPVPVIEYLDDGIGFTDIHLLADEAERDRIEVALDADMVVELDRKTAPCGVLVACPGQRQEERSFFQVEQPFSAALLLLERPFVVFLQLPADGTVEFPDAEELLVPQRSDDPCGHIADGPLCAGLVLRGPNPGGNDRGAVMFGKFLVARIQFVRVFPVVRHCGLAVVGHEHLRDSAEKLEHVDVCVVP